MAGEAIKTVKVIRAKKIRVFPNSQQKMILSSWFGASRQIYNMTVDYLNLPKELKTKGNWMYFAKELFHSLQTDPKFSYLSDIPYQIKKLAVEEAFKAFSTNIKKIKQTGKLFNLKFRSRKDPVQSFAAVSSAIKDKGLYVRMLGDMKLAEPLPNKPKDSRLVKENNQYFLKVPYEKEVTFSESQGKCIALDQGLRTFLTGFSETEVFKIGNQCLSKIARLCISMDKLISKMKKEKLHLKKQRMKKALMKIKAKRMNLIDELHFKSINYIVSNYDIILLPNFNVSDMVSKTKRKLNSKTVRNMLNLNFYQFSQRLIAKAEVLGKQVIRMSEAYTSKTVSWTGGVNDKLGSSKVVKSGTVRMDRDINGARGIFLKALVDSPSFLNERALSSNLAADLADLDQV
ncbi:MAG: transposase [Bacilli bacterium]|nr:transposase [Bacilli bacterium]